jgi:glutamyl-tRNA synthetase
LIAVFKQSLPYLKGGPEAQKKLDAGLWDAFRIMLPAMKERSKTFLELLDNASFLLDERPLKPDAKAAQALETAATRELLGRLTPRLAALPEWTGEAIEAEVRAFAETEGAKLGQVAQPLRAALTGKMVSPPIFEVLAVLGRDESLARLGDQAG